MRNNRRTLVSMKRHRCERRGSVKAANAQRDTLLTLWATRCPVDGDPEAWGRFVRAAAKATHLGVQETLYLMDMVWVHPTLIARREVAALDRIHAPTHPALALMPRPSQGAQHNG